MDFVTLSSWLDLKILNLGTQAWVHWEGGLWMGTFRDFQPWLLAWKWLYYIFWNFIPKKIRVNFQELQNRIFKFEKIIVHSSEFSEMEKLRSVSPEVLEVPSNIFEFENLNRCKSHFQISYNYIYFLWNSLWWNGFGIWIRNRGWGG